MWITILTALFILQNADYSKDNDSNMIKTTLHSITSLSIASRHKKIAFVTNSILRSGYGMC